MPLETKRRAKMDSERDTNPGGGSVLQGDKMKLLQEEAEFEEWLRSILNLDEDHDHGPQQQDHASDRDPQQKDHENNGRTEDSAPGTEHSLDPHLPPGNQRLVSMTSDKKSRLHWTPQLHERFVESINKLGGPFKATPKNITTKMKVDGITILQVKSHLQKYRSAKLMEQKTFARSPKPIQQHWSPGHEAPKLSTAHRNDLLAAGKIPMQAIQWFESQVERSLQLKQEAHGRYLESLMQQAYEVCTPQAPQHAIHKRKAPESSMQGHFSSPPCTITGKRHMQSAQLQNTSFVGKTQGNNFSAQSTQVPTALTYAGPLYSNQQTPSGVTNTPSGYPPSGPCYGVAQHQYNQPETHSSTGFMMPVGFQSELGSCYSSEVQSQEDDEIDILTLLLQA